MKSGKFFNEGHWAPLFRMPYTEKEDKAIIKFFLDNGGYQFRKGTRVWQSMQAKEICPGRTWQSIKSRCLQLFKILELYDVSIDDLIAADKSVYGTTKDDKHDKNFKVDNDDKEETRSHRGSNGRTPYTPEEDQKIIDYIAQNKRYQDVRGKAMWQVSKNNFVT